MSQKSHRSYARENLLGYLLGALEPQEMTDLDGELERNPQLRSDLFALEATLIPLGFPERDDDANFESLPAGLAARTIEFIDDARLPLVLGPTAHTAPLNAAASTEVDQQNNVAARAANAANVQPARSSLSPSGDLRASGARTRWADLVVVASVLLAAAALLFPAVQSSRQSAQIMACQDNLRQLGRAVADSAGRSATGRIPEIPARGKRSTAGYYAVLLHDQQLLDNTRLLVCPGSDLAESQNAFRVPSAFEIDRASGEVLANLHRTVGGSYAYNLGFVENGIYQSAKFAGRANYPILSDAPAGYLPERQSKNHRRQGQNILCEDNSVRFLVNLSAELVDDPYLNRSGLVAAGLDCTDAVLGESGAQPLPTWLLSH